MNELFSDISEKVRNDLNDLMQLASRMTSLPKALDLLITYRNTLQPHEQDFMDFYITVWVEEHEPNESVND